MAKAPTATTPPPTMGFDDLLVKLRTSVEQLESGELTLEQALTVYEQGVGLARQGQQLLDSAQKRVELLVANGPITVGAPVSAVPFDE
jgi:exodeoxyribonuclease VII small subunit